MLWGILIIETAEHQISIGSLQRSNWRCILQSLLHVLHLSGGIIINVSMGCAVLVKTRFVTKQLSVFIHQPLTQTKLRRWSTLPTIHTKIHQASDLSARSLAPFQGQLWSLQLGGVDTASGMQTVQSYKLNSAPHSHNLSWYLQTSLLGWTSAAG